MAYLGLNPF